MSTTEHDFNGTLLILLMARMSTADSGGCEAVRVFRFRDEPSQPEESLQPSWDWRSRSREKRISIGIKDKMTGSGTQEWRSWHSVSDLCTSPMILQWVKPLWIESWIFRKKFWPHRSQELIQTVTTGYLYKLSFVSKSFHVHFLNSKAGKASWDWQRFISMIQGPDRAMFREESDPALTIH